MKSIYYKSDSKIIRDAVHGDIVLDSKFLDIIDTPEFQRLRRIKQLSTGYLLFPTAEHTRFTHSIGTYRVMQLLIEHFIPIIEEIIAPEEVSPREINLALSAALLHDIGHGPFSHAFEGALPIEEQKKHEEWTIEIIKSKESQIYKVLKENFDDEFPNDLANLIKEEKDIKKNRKELNKSHLNKGDIDLSFIMSSLISSQLDADRMDYLMRDAFFTGVTFGMYDMSRLINGLTINVSDNKYLVCVDEKFTSAIEEYLLSRYKMYEGVYLHRFKCEMDILVKKILFRAYELYKDNKLSKFTGIFKIIFDGKDLTIKDYIELDDSYMLSVFNTWKKEGDEILNLLCDIFLNRGKYEALDILDNTDEDIESFENELITILDNHNYETKLEEEYFWINEKQKKATYTDKEESKNIWILNKNGIISDLLEKSKIITEDLKIEFNMCYINFDLLRMNKLLTNPDQAVCKIKDLIKTYNKKNQVEIEKKYIVKDKSIFNKTDEEISLMDLYKIKKSPSVVPQKDVYFDTKSKMLLNDNKTLRIREKQGEYTLTIKTGTKKNTNKTINTENQSERFEYEKIIEINDIKCHTDYILKYLPELKDEMESIVETLTIENKRKKLILTKGDVEFEMVFDDVEYIGTTIAKECQIEIELKSNYRHRVNLKKLTDHLEKNIEELEPIIESKYIRGLQLTTK